MTSISLNRVTKAFLKLWDSSGGGVIVWGCLAAIDGSDLCNFSASYGDDASISTPEEKKTVS